MLPVKVKSVVVVPAAPVPPAVNVIVEATDRRIPPPLVILAPPMTYFPNAQRRVAFVPSLRMKRMLFNWG